MTSFQKSQLMIMVHGLLSGYVCMTAFSTGDVLLLICTLCMGVALILGYRWTRRDVIDRVKEEVLGK